MNIKVKLGEDYFYFSSYDGSHHWCVAEGNSAQFWKKTHSIVPTAMFTALYVAAKEQGFTPEDFDKIKTRSTRESKTNIAKRIGTKRSSGVKKSTLFKSRLTNSIKLF